MVQRLRWFAPDVLFFAIPNGGSRHGAEAVKLKAEGVTAGVPDLFIAEPCFEDIPCRRGRKLWNGLFIEMKRVKGGKVTAAQKEFMAKAEDRGFKCVVCAGADEALKEIESYLGISLRKPEL